MAKDNTCNRHADCKAADEKAKARYEEEIKKPYSQRQVEYRLWSYGAEHCYDECCEDCFGS